MEVHIEGTDGVFPIDGSTARWVPAQFKATDPPAPEHVVPLAGDGVADTDRRFG